MMTPPSAGERTTVGAQRPGPPGDGPAEQFGVLGMLQHQRALEVARAVQPGTQAEMAFEKAPDLRNKSSSSSRVGIGSVVYISDRRTERPRPDVYSSVTARFFVDGVFVQCVT